MKKIKHLVLAVLFLTVGVISQAQVAHINSEELVSAMPETKAMMDELKIAAKNYETEYKAQVNALTAKNQKYKEEAATKTNEENQKRMIEIGEAEQKLQMVKYSIQEELQKKEFELYKPIIEKAKSAIDAVAKKKGIKYVLDAAPGKGLIVFNGEDLLPAVKKHLGI